MGILKTEKTRSYLLRDKLINYSSTSVINQYDEICLGRSSLFLPRAFSIARIPNQHLNSNTRRSSFLQDVNDLQVVDLFPEVARNRSTIVERQACEYRESGE